MRKDIGGPTRLGLIVFGVIFFLVIAGLFFFITSNINQAAPQKPSADEARKSEVTNLSSIRSVRMVVYGPVVGNEERESYQITVSPTSRTIEAYRGYNRTQMVAQTFENNPAGYEQFVYALSRAGYDKRREATEAQADNRGVCATGKQYVYETREADILIASSWSSSCAAAKGTLGGSNDTVKSLFDTQIPNLNSLLKPIKLR